MRTSAAIVLVALLAGCASGLGPNTTTWCGQHLDAVAAEGTHQGTEFIIEGHDPVAWSQYLTDSPTEQAIVTSEAKDGPVIWAKACQRAYQAAHPSATPEPTSSP